MNLLDSSCWLEYIADSPLAGAIEPIIKNIKELIVPSITIYEVAKKLLFEKDQDYALNIARNAPYGLRTGILRIFLVYVIFQSIPKSSRRMRP
jgi:hypothetical protein